MLTFATMIQRSSGLDISARGIVGIVLKLVIFGVIFGLLYFLIDKAPIPEPWKGYVKYILYALVVILIIYFLLSLVGS